MFFSALEINELFPVSIERSVSLTQKIKGGRGRCQIFHVPCPLFHPDGPASLIWALFGFSLGNYITVT